MTFDPASFGLAFVLLAVAVGILLLCGAYRSAASGRYHVSLLCLGTLLMLVDPLLGILVMLAAAVIVALGIDVAMGLMSLVLVVAAYVLALVIALGVAGIATIAGVAR